MDAKTRAYKRAYYARNRGHILSLDRARYWRRREERLGRMRAYNRAHRDIILRRARKWLREHRLERLAYMKAYRARVQFLEGGSMHKAAEATIRAVDRRIRLMEYYLRKGTPPQKGWLKGRSLESLREELRDFKTYRSAVRKNPTIVMTVQEAAILRKNLLNTGDFNG